MLTRSLLGEPVMTVAITAAVGYARAPNPFERRAWVAYRLLAAQGLLVAALIRTLGFGYAGDDINLILMLLGFVIGTAWLLRARGHLRLAGALEGMSLLMLSSMAAACLSTLVCTLNLPFRDPWLAAADRVLVPFLAWPDMARWIAAHDALVRLMCRIYSTLLWQPFVLVAFLAAGGQTKALWRFLTAWTGTLAGAVALFAFMPAVTAFVYYGFVPADVPALTVNAGWRPAELIQALRSGALHEISTGTMTGLISFPSFHTAGAILLAWGWRRVPVIGGVFVLLNLAMLTTVPFVGSHYFADVLAGAVLALTAIAAVEGRLSARPGLARRPVAL